ncbi:hypothetical protein [Cellvibrio sp. PSBB006]|uniref:hypothetical protein n=1 Tax=Cellvibrio sp. PSBB006 TaxID=1987723 RepID=UPI000B3B9447|nr:hypothetical protein [Cellvibrio sp. PSBB006]ARU26087.1 hypothetical protein CBR65_00800 [Cellvibrio sp. PSBB006]
MDRFLKRVVHREDAIKAWFGAKDIGAIHSAIQSLLVALPEDEIFEGFVSGFSRMFEYCGNNPSVIAVDFSWYYAGRPTGEALAYGYEEFKTKGTLSKTDLGPKDIPGVEIKSEPGDMAAEYFAAIPVHRALNEWTKLKPEIDKLLADNENYGDAILLLDEIVNLWNYRIAVNAVTHAAQSLGVASSARQRLAWVVMTPHERNSVAIFTLKQ